MTLSKEDVVRLSMLSRIKIDNPETLANELSGIFSWINQLNRAQIDDIVLHENYSRPQMHERKDRVQSKKVSVLENAPQSQHGFFVVPKIID